MDRNGQVRKEPTLADLEAFEQLLRDSLQAPKPAADPVKQDPVSAPPAPRKSVEPLAAPASTPSSDDRAMAELARLIASPVDLGPVPSSEEMPSSAEVASPTRAPKAGPDAPARMSGTVEATLQAEWRSDGHDFLRSHDLQRSNDTRPSAAQPDDEPSARASGQVASYDPVAPYDSGAMDPLAAFEEELRRFDAARIAEQKVTASAPEQSEPAMPDLRPHYPAEASYPGEQVESATSMQPAVSPARQGLAPQDLQASQDQWYPEQQQPYFDTPPDYPATTPAEDSLSAAEARLASQAAAAAATAGVPRNSGRSKGIFLAMGGIAVAGLAVLGGSFMFGSGKKAGKSGDIPVIAAKTAPTKEKPADPGGIEIPNQNKEVLSARTQGAVKPAQVVNNTEQPLDLNQVTRRDTVRVIAPNPYQPGTPAPDGATAGNPPAANAPPAVEPRRVTSVRIPVGGPSGAAGLAGAAPATASAPAAPPTTAAPSVAVTAPTPPQRTAVEAPSAPVKVESRPITSRPQPETPKSETPKVAPPPRVANTPKAETPRSSNAPLSLAPKAAASGSGWAIQLASRPTESDATAASSRLKNQYASTLGGRSPKVFSGQANGKTVYRIRVTGYDQSGAADACKKIKAAGGGCFITRQ
jgi:hypothetical protein